MRTLSHLKPERVFYYFEEICGIPHASYKEQQISDYLVEFARCHHLEYFQDDLYNVIIIKEATPGYEEEEPIILQGHMDMVCEKEAGCTIDFDRDGLKLCVDGDYVKAEGTTLGGDDGIALAYALAILESDKISHPRLEFVCTVCEEVGMEGATGIDVSMLKGRRLLNLDSEEKGIFLASCAGGCTAECILPVTREQASGEMLHIRVHNLTGGHSGTEIHRGRANASLLLHRILLELSREMEIRLLSFTGGSKDNAIPREAEAVVCLQQVEKAQEMIERIAEEIAGEYATTELKMHIFAERVMRESIGEVRNNPLTVESTKTLIALLAALPNGVQTMSADIPGLVETSLNLGILRLEEDALHLFYSVRSSVGSAKEYLLHRMHVITESMGGSVCESGKYPAWEYRRDSVFREKLIRIYREMFGEAPKVEAIHAGVECGILAGKLPGLDCISMGPDILDIHTPAERLSISSSERMWRFILAVLSDRG
ncbi:MAG: aminoacyl-histidine dipeptidase [Lachnospiraceae bacterium]|nr:aminoacyl-histidine dipeptidase [Lachnospiraceae bacterium]